MKCLFRPRNYSSSLLNILVIHLKVLKISPSFNTALLFAHYTENVFSLFSFIFFTDDSIPFSSEDKIDSPKKLPKTDYTYFDNRMWSKAFFMCLHYACDLSTSNSLMVQTASLEAFVQLLVVRRPLFLFPISWLTSITSCSSPVPLSSNQHLNDNTSNNDILNDKTIIESSSQQYKLYESKFYYLWLLI